VPRTPGKPCRRLPDDGLSVDSRERACQAPHTSRLNPRGQALTVPRAGPTWMNE
jgi:hypothetical protein